jgi:hypothetical protein
MQIGRRNPLKWAMSMPTQSALSATASGNAHGCCFFPSERFKTECTLGINSRSSLVASSETGGPREIFQEKVEKAPVTTRAWTFQDRILSKRVLHFSRGVLLFECSTMLATEYHIRGLPCNAPTADNHIVPVRAVDKVVRYEDRIMALTANYIKYLFRFTLTPAVPSPFVYLLDICVKFIGILRGGSGNDVIHLGSTSKRDGSFPMFPVNSPSRDGFIRMREAFQAVVNRPRRN